MAICWSNRARHGVARIFDFNVRERLLADIQYVVRYRIDADDEITILSIRHTRENREGP